MSGEYCEEQVLWSFVVVCKFGKFTDTSSNTPKVLEVRFCILNIIGEQVYWLSLLNLYMFSLETAVKNWLGQAYFRVEGM